MDHLRAEIETKIRRIAADYRSVPGAILTEDDLKCLLVSRLLEIPELRSPQTTADHVMGTWVHTEVTWFDENGQLRIKPDITILGPKELSIFRSLGREIRLPHKGFSFTGGSIIFELKFIRGRRGVTGAGVASLRRDLTKVDRLFAKLTNDGAADELFCYFVIFSKVSSAVPAFHELINLVNNGARYPRCRIIFGTAGVDWPTVPRHGLCER
jgi:hypothetical protein